MAERPRGRNHFQRQEMHPFQPSRNPIRRCSCRNAEVAPVVENEVNAGGETIRDGESLQVRRNVDDKRAVVQRVQVPLQNAGEVQTREERYPDPICNHPGGERNVDPGVKSQNNPDPGGKREKQAEIPISRGRNRTGRQEQDRRENYRW